MSRRDQVARAPPEPPAHGEEGQPRLVLAREHLQVDAGLVRDPLEHRGAVAGVAHGRRREREQFVAAERLRLPARVRDGAHERVRALACSGRRGGRSARRACSSLLSLCCGVGCGAAVGVDDEQVHGVRPDIQHTEPHASRLLRSARATAASRDGSRFPTRVDRVRRPRRRRALDPRRPHLVVLSLDVHLRPRLPRHARRPGVDRMLQPRRVLLRQGRPEARPQVRRSC